ncbi:replication initiator protein A [Paraburkholderia sp. CI3]|uniref:replication initiator protein A n=1 Tax=Paraburkholderia sp. CI3 TaxID=2991060 RepID=UPI003D202739
MERDEDLLLLPVTAVEASVVADARSRGKPVADAWRRFPRGLAIAAAVEVAPREANAHAARNENKGIAQGIPKGHLIPDRHEQHDFFVADILDAAPKDDLMSMEHPMFALKAGDKRVRIYERNGVTVKVKPGPDGCATIHDKDIWIYCISQLVEALNRGREGAGPELRFTAHAFFVATNRRTDGDSYARMGDALARLKGTVIETNIKTADMRERGGFGLIEKWRVIERANDGRMVAVEVKLPDWLWRSVKSMQVKTLSRGYFRLRKPLDRRIYELVRKHGGSQAKWRVTLAVLHEKSGSTDTLRKFRASIKTLAKSDELPDYRVTFDTASDTVTFYARAQKGAKTQITDLLAGLSKDKRP